MCNHTGGAVATGALRKTAEMLSDTYPLDPQMIIDSIYVDNVVDCCENKEMTIETAQTSEYHFKEGFHRSTSW